MEDNISRNRRNKITSCRFKQNFKNGGVWMFRIFRNFVNSNHIGSSTPKLMEISKEGVCLIKKFEGCKLEAYYDAVNVLTIAYGRTKGVKAGDTCTQEQADAWLEEELQEYGGYVNEAVNVPLSQNQFDALVSWTYNLGPSNLNKSTMLKVLNNGEYEEVPAQMRRWNKAGGKVLEGLTRRRNAESLLFEGKEWGKI
jgi:lysozyme